MNDFTKEELREIFWIIEGCTMDYIGKENNILINKIESMIVNYCDHEWENICCQCTLDKIYCHKCENDMGDLKERYDD